MTRTPTIVFAGGGSGGHIMPGLAIAERLVEIAPNLASVFFCSERAIDTEILSEAARPFHPIESKPLSLKPIPMGPIRFLRGLQQGTKQAQTILRKIGETSPVTHVVAVGGFVAAPSVRAASSLNIPVTLLNLDVVPGKANRFMARYADRIVSAVPCPTFPKFSREIIGMPVRKKAIASETPETCRRQLGLDSETPTLFITGASQGAGSLNDFLASFVKGPGGSALHGWQVFHLCGADANRDELAATYEEAGVRAVVQPFSSNMGLAWGAASLALSRAGASSVAEAAANAVPTLFAPYPWHRDQHQRLNAQPLVDQGGAWLVEDRIEPDLNMESIAPVLLDCLGGGSKVDAAARVLRDQPSPDAALMLAKMLVAGG